MSKLQEGDVIKIEEGHKVYASIPRHFAYFNCKGDFELSKSEARVEGELSYLAGEYIVMKTVMDGGSTGRDSYPDGHHVFCVKAGNPSIKIDFYQSGCFTAMIKDIKPIAKATQIWVKEEIDGHPYNRRRGRGI